MGTSPLPPLSCAQLPPVGVTSSFTVAASGMFSSKRAWPQFLSSLLLYVPFILSVGPSEVAVSGMFNIDPSYSHRWLVNWASDGLYDSYNGTVKISINRCDAKTYIVTCEWAYDTCNGIVQISINW